MKKAVVLLIVDGWGVGKDHQLNPFRIAKHPFIDDLEREYTFGTLRASGVSVGLPWEVPGSSEVGHLTLGIGKVYFQDLVRIDTLIESGEFFSNETLKKMFHDAARMGKKVHYIGLVNSESRSASWRHLRALLHFAKQEKAEQLYLHAFLSGGGENCVKMLGEVQQAKVANIATVSGAAYGLNTSGDFIKTARAFQAITKGVGNVLSDLSSIASVPDIGTLEPSVFDKNGVVAEGDFVVFFHMQGNDIKQLIECFLNAQPPYLPEIPIKTHLVSLAQYQKNWPLEVLFPAPRIVTSVVKEMSAREQKLLKIAEASKENMINFYFNGLTEDVYPFEYKKICKTENLEEELQILFNTVASALAEHIYPLIVANLSVFDKVLHKGTLQDAVRAFELFDTKLKELANQVLLTEDVLIITADHGGVEEMLHPATGARQRVHSANPVPLFVLGKDYKKPKTAGEIVTLKSGSSGGLSDIAPTLFSVLEMPIPKSMTGRVLI